MLPSDELTPPRAAWIAWSSLLLLCAISLSQRAATASLSVSGAVSSDLTFEAVESAFGSRSILTSSARVASLKVDQSAPVLRLALLCSGAGRLYKGPFSAGVPVIPTEISVKRAEISVIPALRRRPLNYPSTAPPPSGGLLLPRPLLPAAMFVSGTWSTGAYPSSLGFAKAGPRSGAGTGN